MPGAQYMLRCYLPCCLSPHIQIKIVLFFPLFIKRTHTHCENVLLRQYLIERSKFHNQVNLLITFFFGCNGSQSWHAKFSLHHVGSFIAAHGLYLGHMCPAVVASGLHCSFLGFPTRVRTVIPCSERQILNHWTHQGSHSNNY